MSINEKPLGFACLPVPEDGSDTYALYDSNGEMWASGILPDVKDRIVEAMNYWSLRARKS